MNGYDPDYEWRGLVAYDTLIIEYGYSHDELRAIYDRLIESHSERYANEYFYRLFLDARKNKIKLKRSTTAEDELTQYYGRELAIRVIGELAVQRRKVQAAIQKRKAA